MSQKSPHLSFYFLDPLWKNNQILVAILGICSALGITSSLRVALTMALAVTFVTGFSSFLVSLIRNYTPDSVRMITQLAVISVFTTIIDQFLKAYFFDLWKVLSVFVGLIITNCIVMGRAEAMAKNIPPLPALMDGMGAGAGYGIILMIVAFFRELLGFGTLFGARIIPLDWYATAEHPDRYTDFALMVNPPAAFFLLSALIWGVNKINKKKG